jgi:uroporphyrinogen decarboxylase
VSDLFLRACRGEAVERTPIWVMRQAGRYLEEYRAVRRKVDFLTLCRTPDLATAVTLQPIDRFSFDAAILFSDILTPAEAMGIDFDFDPGPKLQSPVRDAAAVAAIEVRPPEEHVPYVFETVRMLRRELDGRVPLIGFAASPFTLGAYLVEGGGSKSFRHVKAMLHGAPRTAHDLLEKVTDLTIRYLRGQIDAGAQAVQLFDSWAGLLDPATYEEFSLRYARRALEAIADTGVPRIYFALNAAHLFGVVGHCGADVYGVDWRSPLSVADAALGGGTVLQGNLDPTVLFAAPEVIDGRVRDVMVQAAGLRGHIFNLGHGILPETPVENVTALVESVRRHGARQR